MSISIASLSDKEDDRDRPCMGEEGESRECIDMVDDELLW